MERCLLEEAPWLSLGEDVTALFFPSHNLDILKAEHSLVWSLSSIQSERSVASRENTEY